MLHELVHGTALLQQFQSLFQTAGGVIMPSCWLTVGVFVPVFKRRALAPIAPPGWFLLKTLFVSS
jgi:hypothetical protein